MLLSFARWLQGTPLALYIAQSSTAFPWIETIHVVCMSIVVGTISVLDLRLLYLTSKQRSVRSVSADVLPFTWGAFLLAAITGLLLFTSKATEYVVDFPFLAKMALMACAGGNMVIFHFTTYRTVEAWDAGGIATPSAVRVSAFLSLVFWALVIVCGRWIGFTIR